MYSAKITEDDKKQIYLWAASGVGYTEIVRLLDNRISKQRVHQLCRRKGIDATAKKKSNTEAAKKEWLLKYLSKFFDGKPVIVDADILNEMVYRYSQKKRDPDFLVAFEDIEWNLTCPILGIPLDYTTQGPRQENSPSFDRIDSNLGYVKGNVCIISWRANRIKNDGSAEEHRLISNYMFKRGVK